MRQRLRAIFRPILPGHDTTNPYLRPLSLFSRSPSDAPASARRWIAVRVLFVFYCTAVSWWICRLLIVLPILQIRRQDSVRGFPISMMPGSSSARTNELGPDYFGYYRHLFFELFPQSEGATSAPSKPDLESLLGYPRDTGSITTPTNNSEDRIFHRPVSFFTEVIGEELSKYKKERLKSVLHQTAVCLNREADEVLGRIIATLRFSSDLQEIKQSSFNSEVNEENHEPFCTKKRKLSFSPLKCGTSSFSDAFDVSSQFGRKSKQVIRLLKERTNHLRQVIVSMLYNSLADSKVYEDIKAIQGDGEICHEAVRKYSHQINDTLSEMEENIEKYLDMVVTKCRPMTSGEKQVLGRKIHKLPGKALDGVVEIIQRKDSAQDTSDNVSVNLEKLDNVTLWRLYYYVQSIVKVREL